MNGAEHRDCGRIPDLLDVYLDNELPAAEVGRVGMHLANCVHCREEMAARVAFRQRLREAARSTPVPGRLGGKEFVNSALAGRPVYSRPAWAAIAAGVLLVVSAGSYEIRRLRNNFVSQDSYIAHIAGETAPIVRVGLKDHVHCAVFRKFPPVAPSIEEMAAKVGPEYADLIPAVQTRVPAGMKVVLAHKCSYRGRQYVHLIAGGGSHLLSLVIAKRSQGEAFERDLRAVAIGSDVALYSTGIREFAVAGFETAQHLVYVISDMDQTQNLQMLIAMTPQVRRILLRSET